MFELHEGQASSTIIIGLPVDCQLLTPFLPFWCCKFSKFNKWVNLDENRQSIQITESNNIVNEPIFSSDVIIGKSRQKRKIVTI